MGHWYTRTGAAAHFQPNGKDTTLREARKQGLFYSVTDVIRTADRPALTNWLINQAMDACLTLPRLPEEPLEAFKERARKDAQAQADKARDDGSAIHAAIEASIKGKPWEAVWNGHVRGWQEAMEAAELPPAQFQSEVTFAHPLGFGGCVDLSGGGIVADLKTKA